MLVIQMDDGKKQRLIVGKNIKEGKMRKYRQETQMVKDEVTVQM